MECQEFLCIVSKPNHRQLAASSLDKLLMNTSVVGILGRNPAELSRMDGMEHALRARPSTKPIRFSNYALTISCMTETWIGHEACVEEPDGAIWILLGSAYSARGRIDLADLIKNHKKEGDRFLTSLSGTYAILFWDHQNQRLSIVMDRLATQKLFVFQKNGLLLFSTELSALLAHPDLRPRVDTTTLAQFLACSHPINERTLIRDVTVLQPATITVWSMRGASTREYWKPVIGDGADSSLDSWADQLGEALRTAVAARVSDTDNLLPVTGGLDSRAIAAFLPESTKRTLQCCTFGHAHCYDVRYGRRVARALGARYQFLRLNDHFFHDYLPCLASLCDGEASIAALPMLRLLDAAEPGSTLLSGYLGDVLSGSHMPNLTHCHGDTAQHETAWNILFGRMGFSESQMRKVLLPEHHAEIEVSPWAFLATLYDRTEVPDPTHKIVALKLRTRQWRFTSYMGRILGSHYRFEAPFLDNDTLNVFLSMPLRHRLDQRAYRRMLVRHAPHLAAIPEIETHRPVSFTDTHAITHGIGSARTDSSTPFGWRFNALRRSLGNLVVDLSGGWIGPHNRDYYVHHDENIRHVDPTWFRNRLLGHPFVAEWFDLAALETLWNEHTRGVMDHSIRINNIIAFLSWYESMRQLQYSHGK